MKSKLYLLFVLICVYSWLQSVTHHITQDGSGDYTEIQEGIDASIDADTVLVYPGIYFENIDYIGKSITVASLYIITLEDSLINQTIIDGNQLSRCVTIENCETVKLIGFTIQNGKVLGTGWTSGSGGGVLSDSVTNSLISNCIIKNNTAYSGGGLYFFHCDVMLSGNTISHNLGIRYAGGIGLSGNDTTLQFSDMELNNIYLNYSATGSDIYIGYNIPDIVNIIADTLTINDPDFFFIGPSQQCTISQLNSKIEEIDQDLYVAPNGDDENNGLTPDEPLQTIAWAQTLIKRNDENPHTMHLAAGTYSATLNNQLFPMNIKQGVVYKGVSADETILDAESDYPFFYQYSRPQTEFSKLVMENLKLINGKCMNESYAGGIIIYQADLHLKNVIIENCNGDWAGAIQTSNGYCNLDNVFIRNNNGQCAISLTIEYNCPNPVRDVNITNSQIKDNYPNIIDPDFPAGGAIKISGHPNIPGEYNAKLINCEISDNHNASNTGLGGSVVMYAVDNINIDILNCTFADNTLILDTGCSISVENSELNLYNSILYNNDGYSLNLLDNAIVNISNSLIEGGDENIYYYYPQAIVNWLEGNLDENPLWLDTGDYPYYLQSESPCIDAGTLDLPAGIELPEYDLAGNPRIYGNTIDIGAYEWQGVDAEEDVIQLTNETRISNYPNPFNPSTIIKLELAESGETELSIYNIKGQKVKTLLDAFTNKGTFEMKWNGKDEMGKSVSSGQYVVKLQHDGKETASKIMLLK
jgi:FlgD Ig-like domain